MKMMRRLDSWFWYKPPGQFWVWCTEGRSSWPLQLLSFLQLGSPEAGQEGSTQCPRNRATKHSGKPCTVSNGGIVIKQTNRGPWENLSRSKLQVCAFPLNTFKCTARRCTVPKKGYSPSHRLAPSKPLQKKSVFTNASLGWRKMLVPFPPDVHLSPDGFWSQPLTVWSSWKLCPLIKFQENRERETKWVTKRKDKNNSSFWGPWPSFQH